MKYVITWEANPSATSEQAAARSLQVFGKWSPSESATFKEFVSRVDGRGGFAVVETDDPATILHDAAMFGTWFEFNVFPVLEIADATAINIQVVETLASIS